MRASHADCAFGAVEDFRFEELRCQINPQSGANAAKISVDKEADLVDAAARADIGGKILILAGRPQPPQAVAIVANDIRSICNCKCNCKIRRLTLSCTTGVEIFIRFRYAKQEHLILCCVAEICVARM